MAKIVRTKTKATGGITAAEKAEMDEISREWIGIAMRTEPADPAKLVPAIHSLYAAAGLKKPRVVIAPSPLVMAFAYGAAAWIWHCRKNNMALKRNAAATGVATRAATDAATGAATYAATDAATRAATGANIGNKYAEAGAIAACTHLAGEGGIKCAERWCEVHQGGAYWAGISSFYVAARDVLGLELPALSPWEDAARHGAFRALHKEFCIVSDFPEIIRKDDQNRPHCETGPSHRWRDGWSLYHWHGVRVPGEWIEDRDSLTASIALSQNNAEVRRAACEMLGWSKILADLNAKVIDTDADPEIGTLIEADLPGSPKSRFLRVLCGTKREFAIPVPQEMSTALEAQAWTWGLDKDIFVKPEIRT